MKSSLISSLLSNCKRFPNRPFGIPTDFRRTLDDIIRTEVWGDAKSFNTISTYCDNWNTDSGDG